MAVCTKSSNYIRVSARSHPPPPRGRPKTHQFSVTGMALPLRREGETVLVKITRWRETTNTIKAITPPSCGPFEAAPAARQLTAAP